MNDTAPCNQLGGPGAVLSGIEVATTPNFLQITWGLPIAYAHNLHLLDL
ncbi:MAG: hypothetical protein ACXVX9_03850 [Mycobacteriaceae bacterium]